MTLTLTGYKLYPVRIPYRRPVRWSAHSEAGLDTLILGLETTGGAIGIGEASVRLEWTAATLKSLACVVEEVFMPRMIGMDLEDEALVTRFLRSVREHSLAKQVIDCAIWDLRAQAAGVPLYQALGGTASVPVAWTVTRAEPAEMAAEAARVVEAHGFTSLKVKTGQGLATDREVLARIRKAVGSEVTLSADSNRAYRLKEIGPLTDMFAEFGVVVAEDPMELRPDDTLLNAKQAARMPLLVDSTCRSIDEADAFLRAGAEAISVKVFKTGISGSLDIIRRAAARDVAVHVGLSASSSIGAAATLGIAGSVPVHRHGLPSEESFFLMFATEYVLDPLTVTGGHVRLPETALFDWIDWTRVRKLAA